MYMKLYKKTFYLYSCYKIFRVCSEEVTVILGGWHWVELPNRIMIGFCYFRVLLSYDNYFYFPSVNLPFTWFFYCFKKYSYIVYF
jgi:hypothetical protein